LFYTTRTGGMGPDRDVLPLQPLAGWLSRASDIPASMIVPVAASNEEHIMIRIKEFQSSLQR
jgi:hypothetical protein